MGVEVIHDDFAAEFLSENGRVKGCATLAGREISADMVGYGIGNDANISMLEGSGVANKPRRSHRPLFYGPTCRMSMPPGTWRSSSIS